MQRLNVSSFLAVTVMWLVTMPASFLSFFGVQSFTARPLSNHRIICSNRKGGEEEAFIRCSSPVSLSLSSSSASSPSEASEEEIPDYTGKTIYQRTFYRLTPASTVSHPNALIIEERLRYKPDPNNDGYILPYGPRTLVLREGTNEDRITKELYRINLMGSDATTSHSGPGTMDMSIATMLYLASHPELIQGDVLELNTEEGTASLVGCIGAKFVLDSLSETPGQETKSSSGSEVNDDLDIMTVPHQERLFPKRMHHLTLSEEGRDGLRTTADSIKGLNIADVAIKEIPWSTRIAGRHYDHFYRLVVGSDIDFTYPEAKELARTIANLLLPSNEFSVASIKDAVDTGSSAGTFGAIGMDIPETSPSGSTTRDPETEVDPKFPATFVHICPDTRENTTYLRQFLEKGFRMTVNTGYLKMERLQFVFQAIPEDEPESNIEDMDLELQDEAFRSYQSLNAIHHPDYSGEGSGEYFFPMETGEYEGGSRSTYLEPEEGGSLW